MAYTRTTWQQRLAQYQNRFSVTNNPDGTLSLTPFEGTVTQAGIAITPDRLNNAERGIELAHLYGVTTNTGNAYVLSTGKNVTLAELTGIPIRAKMSATSTGNATLNVDGQGAFALKTPDGVYADIASGGIITVVFDGTATFFVSNGAGVTPFQAARTSTDVTLVANVKVGQFIYSNEPVRIEAGSDIPIDHSIPVSVIGSAYDTSGGGGRKLVRLSNGWLVATAINGTTDIRFYVSKDSGATWSLLTAIATGLTLTGGVAICSVGTIVHFIVGSGTNIYLEKFDATTVGTTYSLGAYDETQNAIGSGVSIATSASGVIHATWCSKNTSYPNSLNIRYSRSTDAGATWSTPAQVTAQTISGFGCEHPCVVVLPNEYPVIVARYFNSTPSYAIHCYKTTNGTTWDSDNYNVRTGSTYQQYRPCAAVDSAGNIHVVWYGYDSSYTTNEAIQYSKSTDGGATWSTVALYSPGASYSQVYPTISIDSSDVPWVIFCGKTPASTTYYQISKMSRSSGAWNAVTTITSASSAHQYYPQACLGLSAFTDPVAIWQDNQASAIKFRGVWVEGVQDQLIPAIDSATALSQITATAAGALMTYGVAVKRYSGFVSSKAVGTLSAIDTYTKLLLHMNGINGSTTFTDSSPTSKTVTAYGNAQISTAQSVFGDASGLFDGNGDYLSVPDSVDWSFGSGDFTIEFRIRPSAVNANMYIISQRDDGYNYGGVWVQSNASALCIAFGALSGGAWADLHYTGYGMLPLNTWKHVAVVRNGLNRYIFVDGVAQSLTNEATGNWPNFASLLRIGQDGTSGSYFNGYLDELRISYGIARWTTNFTPPPYEYA